MRSVTRLLPFQTYSRQETFVAQYPPQRAPHLRVVSPVSPAPFGSSPTSCRLHRLEGFSCDELAVKGAGEHEQHIGRQVSQIVVSRFIFAPAPADLPAQNGKRLLGGFAPRITDRKAIALLFQAGHFRLELINLATQPRLPAIKGARIQEKGMPDLIPVEIDHTGGDQHSHAPIETQDRLNFFNGGAASPPALR
jgi:hypothetical protein